MKPEHQREILDHYANHQELMDTVITAYQNHEKLKKELITLQNLQGQEDKLALLQYQIREFEELNVKQNEIEELQTEHRKLAHAEQWLDASQHAIAALKIR